jgi:hypothetical protein
MLSGSFSRLRGFPTRLAVRRPARPRFARSTRRGVAQRRDARRGAIHSKRRSSSAKSVTPLLKHGFDGRARFKTKALVPFTPSPLATRVSHPGTPRTPSPSPPGSPRTTTTGSCRRSCTPLPPAWAVSLSAARYPAAAIRLPREVEAQVPSPPLLLRHHGGVSVQAGSG